MTEKNDLIIGCDWGTSIFRLRIIEPKNLDILAHFEIPEGIAKVNRDFLNQEEQEDRVAYFQTTIAKYVKELAQKVSFELDGLPIVASGMISSSIGMQELPYADLPFPLSYSGLNTLTFEPNELLNNPLTIVSGLKDANDVMRGEEVQLLGLSTILPNELSKSALVILPGTHSKHCMVECDQLVSFQTYMTGELYQLLVEHSILNNSVFNETFTEWSQATSSAFKRGVLKAGVGNILSDLFKVRTNFLLEQMDKKANAMFLSGLLIGEELSNLKNLPEQYQIILCGGDKLGVFYAKAIETLGLGYRTISLPEDIITRVTIAGQVEVSKIQRIAL
ncbi:2-dehydro-3-deoxygalactonokinase [Marinilongibacter aquaticus]|uniref:2-dehydro-3-deoxygalactonokinase n=1 Tax=Marinilongibacter aquaticus TaxID=2975157 RepID=UPI0021BD1408|nr:2-dehydro-3-deoxygalactonokinase [Marinilongibacter aquaticus]UBM59351.1 2-dehydro-3-deoxygalactonokinase [Marinilongibacter aquaticus]